jgi:tetratricopeptide (TPR) repeat protein
MDSLRQHWIVFKCRYIVFVPNETGQGMTVRIWLALGAAIGLALSPAVAQSTPEEKCNSKGHVPDDERLAACTALIESGKYGQRGILTGLFVRAKISSHKQLFDAAIADYTEVIRLTPTNEFAYLERGRAYCNKGEFDRAIADYDHVIELNPRSERAYGGRGDARLRNGDLDRAIADFDKAIALNPKDANAFVYRSAVFRAKDDLDRAMADCVQAIEIAPKHKLAYFCRGYVYKAAGEVARAIADFDRAIELDAKDASAYRVRGIVYFQSGAFLKALDDFEQSLRFNPQQAYAALWRDLAAGRASQPSMLKEEISRLDMTKWPAPLVRLMAGEISTEALFAATDDSNAAIKKNRLCEANFFAGELAVRRNEKEEAARLLRLAVADCPKTFFEWQAARVELKALTATP